MALTAQDVENQVFRQEFRGYNQEEVDQFLDLVSARLVELTTERDELAERVKALDESGGGVGAGDVERLSRTLILAERAAEEAVNEAKAEAQQLLEDARREAQQLLDQAREEAERLVSEARRDATAERQESAVVAQRIQRATEELRRFNDEYRDRVQAVIAEQLAVLDRIGDLPTLTPALEDASRDVAALTEVGAQREAAAAPAPAETSPDDAGRDSSPAADRGSRR